MKKAIRGAYIVSHPVGAAKNSVENALLDALLSGGGGRRAAGSPSRRQGYVYAPSSSPSSYAASAERADLAAQIDGFERWLLSRHLEDVPVASYKQAPPAPRPDETAARARFAADLGVPDLERWLLPYGSPPRAPEVELGDIKSLERTIRAALVEDVPFRRLAQRRAAGVEARARAAEEYAAELNGREEEQLTLQAQLDHAAIQLSDLRAQVDAAVEEWNRKETQRLDQIREAQQRTYDDEWQRLQSNDPPTVVTALREAFAGEAVTILGAVGGTALIVVACPDLGEIIAGQEPGVTAAGVGTIHKRSKTRINDLYTAAIGSRTLAAVKRALAAAPALDGVACVSVRPSGSPDLGWEAVYLAKFERRVMDELRGGCWSDEPDDILEALDRPREASYDAGGRTHELQALSLDEDPALRAVIERMDDRDQEGDERTRLDQAAAEGFLRSGPASEDYLDEPLEPEIAGEPQVVIKRAAVLQRADPDADSVQSGRELSRDEDPVLQPDATDPSPEARSLKPRLVRPQTVEPASSEPSKPAHHGENGPRPPAGESRTAKLRRSGDRHHD